MRKIIFLIVTVLVTASCKKWLDVKPVSQVSKDDLFETESGFQEALNGLYARSTKTDLYGKELSFGFPDVLAQNYNLPAQSTDKLEYLQTALYNYQDKRFIGRKDSVWNGLYHSIANANLLLENIEIKRNVLSADKYVLIKAEALALRGYFHFDLLRLFAPVNAAGKGIPYVSRFTNNVTPVYTVGQVCDSIARDLNEAKLLIKPIDPIMSIGYAVGYNTDVNTPEQGSSDLFLQNRRHRMNYYAICASLARVNLYRNNYPEAKSNALEVIDSKKFPWTQQADLIHPDPQQKDRVLYKELVFGWYVPRGEKQLDSLFESGVTGFFIERNGGEALYETGGVGGLDNRFKQWLQFMGGTGADRYELRKYTRDPILNRHYLMAPAIRLSEVYYIAAEASYDTDPATAFRLVDSVRYHRGIGVPFNAPNKEIFLQELVKEARKEFYGEGQIFYMYKRLNRAIVAASGGNIPPSEKIFVLPLPNNEIEFGNR